MLGDRRAADDVLRAALSLRLLRLLGTEVDDHDTLTASLTDGTYAGFSCDDWTSVTAQGEGGGFMGGPMAGHMWPAGSGMHWGSSHGVPGCGAGASIEEGGGGPGGSTVGGLGDYGALYCFALPE